MKTPSIDLYVARPSRATFEESGTLSCATSEKRWGKIPWSVGTDPALTAVDVRVYFALAVCRRNAAVSVGTRWIGETVHLGRNIVARSLRRLVELKYVDIEGGKRGGRPTYHLTSHVFTAETGQATVVLPPKPGSIGSQNRAVPVMCKGCRRLCKRLPDAGICRSCLNVAREEKRTERTARRVAREEIAALRTEAV